MYPFRLPIILALLLIAAGSCGPADDGEGDNAPAAAVPDTANATSEQTTPREAADPADPSATAPDTTDTARVPGATQAPRGDPIVLDPTTAAQIEEIPQQDAVRMLRRTAQIYSGMSGMRAEFAMLTRNPLLGTRVSSRGTLYQRRPDRIRLDFTDPAGDVIVGDGDFFWVYYPSVDPVQVTKTPVAGTAGVVDLQAQFVGDPVTNFDHTVDGREDVDGRDAVILSLVPRENRGYAKLKVWIDTQDNLVRRFEITDPNGVTRLLDLRSLQTSPTLSDSLFRFVPPPGTHVVERG
jgi:outer membrane lipoprotein carrier protein